MPEQNDSISEEIQPESQSLKAVEDLTLSELLGAFLRQPTQTVQAFSEAITDDVSDTSTRMLQVATDSPQSDDPKTDYVKIVLNWVRQSRLFWYGIAFIFVFIGNITLAGSIGVRRSEEMQLASGTPYIVIGFLVWLLAELYFSIPSITIWWRNRNQPESSPTVESVTPSIPLYEQIPLSRFVFALAGMIFSAITWYGTANNTFNMPTYFIWLASIFFWSITFAPFDFNVFNWLTNRIDKWRSIRWRNYVGVIIALALIIGVAAQFRFHRLDQHPREMTDDHVEKILDAGRVRDGARNIFFANNGGREPLQMYLIAMASHLPGLGIDFFTIKFVSATESLLTIPILFWMGYALLEGETKRRRLLIGVLLAGLVAVSYWHVAITRQGLRIPLTPLVVGLQLIYLMRAIRHNRRSDFIISGLILGFGLYTYQAVRMLPVVIVVAVAIAIVFNAKTIRDRLHYVFNLSVLVGISFVVFLPMFRFSVDSPELFWRRTTGRLLGDDVIQQIQADGTVTYRDATTQERFDAFVGNLPLIANNVRNVLLMFNWEGDVATISGVSLRPAMDTLSATLLIVGLAAWIPFAIRRRDTVYWLVPITAFLMLLPSALSIAFPAENPSHTRTSGAIPLVYLMAAFPLALVIERILDSSDKVRTRLVAVGIGVLVLGGAYNSNANLYFQVYPERYEASFDPYSDAGQYLYGYILSGGAYGNSYLIGAEHWWSHRAIGLEAGLTEFWPNGIWPYIAGEYSTDPIVSSIYASIGMDGTFQFRPDADLIFFYSPNDDDTAQALADLFPMGIAYERNTYKPNETFMVYEVPALGDEGLQTWLEANPLPE